MSSWLDVLARAYALRRFELDAFDATVAQGEQKHRAAVERIRTKPQLWRAYKTRLRLGTWPPDRRPQNQPREGHAPRRACTTRTRGSRRKAAATRAGPDDPGDSDPDGEHPLAARDTAGVTL